MQWYIAQLLIVTVICSILMKILAPILLSTWMFILICSLLIRMSQFLLSFLFLSMFSSVCDVRPLAFSALIDLTLFYSASSSEMVKRNLNNPFVMPGLFETWSLIWEKHVQPNQTCSYFWIIGYTKFFFPKIKFLKKQLMMPKSPCQLH